MNPDAGRLAHYRDFYRPPEASPAGSEPLWLVVGNCQAEALRLLLDSVPGRPYRTVRIPPVFELTADDLPYLDALLARTTLLVTQPVRPDYRALPVGTAQLAERLPRSASVLRWPVIRYAGLYPFQVIARDPADRSVVPPAVPYHDLRTVAAARDDLPDSAPWDVDVPAEQLVAVAEASRDELARRERRDTDVGVSDVLAGAGAEASHTINHPGNPVLVALARRILASQGISGDVDAPEKTLLGSVYAPLEARVLAAAGIDAPARPDWLTDAGRLRPDEVHETQLRWYRANPVFVDLVLQRHAATVHTLGLDTRVSR